MSGDAIGMLGPGGGWGIPIAPPTLMITVGGIATKPRYLNGQLEPRELLDLTISVDHDIVDGAPAARFARRLAELVEAAEGLDTVSWAGPESGALGAG
jgi:pyruvate/2-oxoglutarate dehydrogenase complex dihydrolipoamide acyltransferase (E2) component